MSKKIKNNFIFFMLIIALTLLVHTLNNPKQACYGWEREIIKKEYEIKPIEKKDLTDILNYGNCLSFITNKEYKNNGPRNIDRLTRIKNILIRSEQNSPFKITHISNMNVARVFSKVIRLKNGKVLIIGGNKGSDKSAELFEPETNKFKFITNTIKLPTFCFVSEVYQEPLLLPDEDVYYNGIVYNPKTNKFSEPQTPLSIKLFEFDKKLSLETKRKSKSMLALQSFSDSTVLIGKDCTDDKICSEVYLYDPIKDKEYKTVKLNLKKHFEQAIKLTKSNILILSNADDLYIMGKPRNKNGFELYNIQTGICEVLKDNITVARILTKVNKDVLVRNITNSEVFGLGYHQNLILYNLESNLFSTLQSSNFKNDFRCLLDNNYALFSSDSYIGVLDISKNEFSRIFDPNISWYGQTFTVLENGNVLITGGKYIVDYETYTENTERSTFTAVISFK